MPDALVTRELLVRCRRGDRLALEELVHLTHRRAFALAYRLVGDRYEAEDVVQEAYLRMFRGLPGFREEEARFETWMHRIVVNTAVSGLRKRGRFGDLMKDELPDVPVLDRAEQRTVERDALERGLAALPAGQRTALVLKDIYGLSCREIGHELGIEEGAVKVRLHRARKGLRELLSEEGFDREA